MSKTWQQRGKTAVIGAVWTLLTAVLSGNAAVAAGTLSLSMRNVDIAEIMELLSTRERINIVLGSGVQGEVSVNLYDMSVDTAVRTVADAAGFAVEHRDGSYFIVRREEAGKYSTGGLTELRTFEVHYADVAAVGEALSAYLSSYGKVTSMPARKLLVVEDTPRFMARAEKMLKVLDRRPRQVLIEAKILEVLLDDESSYGLDWSDLFSSSDGSGSYGIQGLGSPGSPGLFFNLSNSNVNLALDALRGRGRVRTLSTPQLLALENQEASVVVGDRQGFRVTTTINQVTSETIEFLESGVILRVTPTIDAEDRIMLEIHPEVSSGAIADGIPSQTTTEVTTTLLVPDGNTVFIGGLIKNTLTETSDGIPVLGSLPGLRRIFANEKRLSVNTETIVLIRPRLVTQDDMNTDTVQRDVERHEAELQEQKQRTEREVERLFPQNRQETTAVQEQALLETGPPTAPVAIQPAMPVVVTAVDTIPVNVDATAATAAAAPIRTIVVPPAATDALLPPPPVTQAAMQVVAAQTYQVESIAAGVYQQGGASMAKATSVVPTPSATPGRAALAKAQQKKASTEDGAALPTSLQDRWLAAQHGERYVLQLTETADRPTAEALIERHRDGAPFLYFERAAAGGTGFLVTYGLYPNRAAAQVALAQLPEPLQKLSPFPRSIASVRTQVNPQQLQAAGLEVNDL